jgi:hypothetical protein
LTSLVLTVSIRQILLQRQGGSASKTGILGIIAALVAGACPCYYLVPLIAAAGAIGGALGALGILLNVFQIPIKLGAMLILVVATYKLNKSGVCKIKPSRQSASKQSPPLPRGLSLLWARSNLPNFRSCNLRKPSELKIIQGTKVEADYAVPKYDRVV